MAHTAHILLLAALQLSTPAAMAIYPNFVDPNRPNPNGSDDASFIIYGYVPSIVLGVIGTVRSSSVTAVAPLFLCISVRLTARS